MDENSKEFFSNQEIAAATNIFLAFIDRANSKNTFTLPASKEPKIGYETYDTRKFIGKDGQTYRERHIGNKVVDIKYSS